MREGTSAAPAAGDSADEGGVGAVRDKLRRVSWADEKGAGGGGGGALTAAPDCTDASAYCRSKFGAKLLTAFPCLCGY